MRTPRRPDAKSSWESGKTSTLGAISMSEAPVVPSLVRPLGHDGGGRRGGVGFYDEVGDEAPSRIALAPLATPRAVGKAHLVDGLVAWYAPAEVSRACFIAAKQSMV